MKRGEGENDEYSSSRLNRLAREEKTGCFRTHERRWGKKTEKSVKARLEFADTTEKGNRVRREARSNGSQRDVPADWKLKKFSETYVQIRRE